MGEGISECSRLDFGLDMPLYRAGERLQDVGFELELEIVEELGGTQL
jgi:hypothetical protein